jgi:adenosylhomocysteine nucleosidase
MTAPIGIMAALPQEVGDFASRIQSPTVTKIARRRYTQGFFGTPGGDDATPVVVCVARVGKVAAASTATTLIQQFGVKTILFVGLAGGLDAAHAVRVGDIVIASHVAQHDLNASPIFPKHEIPLLGITEIPTDPNWSAKLTQAAQDGIAGSNAQVHTGLILSGDQFINSASGQRALQTQWPAALAVEMEGAAVGQVCYEHGIPFAIARTISDRADDLANHDFPTFLETVAAPRANALLRALFP